jgi:hypothetical protein
MAYASAMTREKSVGDTGADACVTRVAD